MKMFRADKVHGDGYEHQAKFIQDRITSVEKHFAELCSAFGDYTRKTARLRDKGDELARVLKEYADSETVNKSLCGGLENTATAFSAVEEYRNAEVQRLETKVMGELAQYEGICKHAREELKHTISVRERELGRRKVLEKAKERQPFNRQQISYAESELLKATAEMSRTAKSLTEQTEFFEKRKLQQLKAILCEFMKIEISFHAKALELLTLAYQQVDAINEKSDLELVIAGLTGGEPVNFRKKLRSPEKQISGGGMSTKAGSLGSLLNQNNENKDEKTSDSEDSEESGDSSESDSRDNKKK